MNTSIPATDIPASVSAPVQSAAHPAAAANSERLTASDLIAITSLGHFLCHLSETMYGAVLVAVMTEFALDAETATALPALGFALLGLGALPVGYWADSWGMVGVFRCYFLAVLAASLLVALAPSVWLLFAALTVLGLALSIYHPVGLALLSMNQQSRGRAMGINGVAGNIGIALGPTLGTLLRAPGWWRLAYVIVAVFALICYIYLSWLLRGRRAAATDDLPPVEIPLTRPAVSTQPTAFSWSMTLPLLLLYGAMMLGGLNYRCLITALPTFLTEQDATAAALSLGAIMVFITLLLGGVGQLLGGWLADRHGARYVYPACIGLLLLLALLVGSAGGGLGAFALSSGLAIFLFGLQPVENSLLAEWTSRGRRGLSYGTKFALTFGLGSLGAPLVGVIWEQTGHLNNVFYLISGIAALMLLLAATSLLSRSLTATRIS